MRALKEYPDTELKKREKAVEEVESFAKSVNANNVPFGLALTSSPSSAAFGIGETFELTDGVMTALQEALVPDAVLKKLAPLKNKRMYRDDFA